ncbi:terminase small subunit [Escherichia coli]|uniref:terminase small subunit n=1 Tax=Escherichia coli TaxID=562 RepID=UPI003F508159
MEVNKKQLADIFGASIRTIQNWQEQGMPVLRGGGKGNEVLYDSAAVIRWYAERDAEIENEKLRREVEELRQASETDLQPGTIEYERHRLTRAQADAQELKNARDSAEVVETAFCTFVLSRIAGEIASILDGIPLSVQRRLRWIWAAVRRTTSHSPVVRSGASVTSPRMTRPTISKPMR